MFHIIALICLFTGTLSDAFGNGTKLKGLNCTEWFPSKLNDLWLCGAEFNTTKVWLCIPHNSSNNSGQTSLLHVECAKKLQSPSNCNEGKHETATAQTTPQTREENKFWMPFIYGAAAGAGFMIFMAMILYIHYCRLKKRRTKTLNDRAVVDTEYGMTETFLSVDQETMQPFCEDDVDAIVEPEESEQDLYLAPVDLHAETGRVIIKNETPADKNTRHDPIYANVDEQTGFPPVSSTAIEDGGDIEGESGAAEVTTTSKKGDVRLKFGKHRYQDLKRPKGQEHPTYENCEEGSRMYMNLLIENNQRDGRSEERPSSVAYVNAP